MAKAAKVYGLTGPDDKPGLTLTANAMTDVDLVNTLAEETMIHWHGLKPAVEHDGVPDMPMPLLKPGEVRRYLLPGGRPGTHWMHAHTLQEQNLLAAPLIVRDASATAEQEAVVLLHDFSFTAGRRIAVPSHVREHRHGRHDGHGPHEHWWHGSFGHDEHAGDGPFRHGHGGMMGMDINDIEYDAYLANDRTLDDPEIVRVDKGGLVRVRIINGAASTAFLIDSGALSGEVIAVDGQDIQPIPAQQFPLAMGQRVDFRFRIPAEGGAFPILARREGSAHRTGLILATAGAVIDKVAAEGDAETPVLSLDAEYALRAAVPISRRAVDRTILVNLFGNMHSYEWGIEANAPLAVRKGERVVIEMRNHSMMTHPMHLHGHHFQIVSINGEPIEGAVRDTVFLQPMASVAFAFDADNPAMHWAFHCHHLYHMASGMMTSIRYETRDRARTQNGALRAPAYRPS